MPGYVRAAGNFISLSGACVVNLEKITTIYRRRAKRDEEGEYRIIIEWANSAVESSWGPYTKVEAEEIIDEIMILQARRTRQLSEYLGDADMV